MIARNVPPSAAPVYRALVKRNFSAPTNLPLERSRPQRKDSPRDGLKQLLTSPPFARLLLHLIETPVCTKRRDPLSLPSLYAPRILGSHTDAFCRLEGQVFLNRQYP